MTIIKKKVFAKIVQNYFRIHKPSIKTVYYFARAVLFDRFRDKIVFLHFRLYVYSLNYSYEGKVGLTDALSKRSY